MQVIYCGFLPIITREFYGFSADSDRVPDGLSDGSTDESNDVEFPMKWIFRKFCPAILMGIFTMNLSDGWTDRMDDGHTDRQMDFQVQSCLG